MKRYPHCNGVETDHALVFCRTDDRALVADSSSLNNESAKMHFATSRTPAEVVTNILPNATMRQAQHWSSPSASANIALQLVGELTSETLFETSPHLNLGENECLDPRSTNNFGDAARHQQPC